MSMKHAVLVLAGINLLGAISAPGSGVAYFAHLGGGLCGYLYLKSELIRRQVSYLSPSNIKFWRQKKKIHKMQSGKEELTQEVDRILDKISKYGKNSLSRGEKRTLERKSRGD